VSTGAAKAGYLKGGSIRRGCDNVWVENSQRVRALLCCLVPVFQRARFMGRIPGLGVRRFSGVRRFGQRREIGRVARCRLMEAI
jgi:hypothetical protein